MPSLANRVRMTTATTGTGTITLGSAVPAFQSFADGGILNGDVVFYVIEEGSNWEIGTGTYTSSGTTMSRTVAESSNSDAPLNLTGSAQVYITPTLATFNELPRTNTVNTFTATQTITPAANTSALTSTGYSLTGSNAQSLLDLAGTWNTTGTPTAIKLNVTDTASDANSLLMDLQVGGASRFNINKSGTLTVVAGSATAGSQSITFAGQTNVGLYANSGQLFLSGNAINFVGQAFSTSNFNVTSNTGLFRIGSSYDAIISRRGAANLRFGDADAASPVAQTLSVQSVVAGTTNTAGANLTITGSQGTGTGAGGSIILQVAPAGSSGSSQNALATALTIDSNRNFTFGSLVTQLWHPTGGSLYFGDSVANIFRISRVASFLIMMDGDVTFGFTPPGSIGGSPDTILRRDAANTLALRNDTNAQTFRVYNTWSSSGTNFERFNIGYDGSGVLMSFTAGGTGNPNRAVRINSNGAFFNVGDGGGFTFGGAAANWWQITSSGHLITVADNAYDIGAVSGNRPRYFYLAGGSLTGSAANSSLEISPTWNTTGTPTAIKLNVTDTASNASSLLMDLQVGGSSKYAFRKDGLLTINYPVSGTSIRAVGNGNGFIASAFGSDNTGYGPYGPRLQSDNTIEWSTSSNGLTGASVVLRRRATANLSLGQVDAAAPVAQTLSVQSVVAGTTNTAGANFTITGSQGTGSGAGGRLELQFAPANGGGATIQNPLVRSFSFFGLSATASFLYGPADATYLLLGNDVALENGNTARPIEFRTNGGPVNITGSGAYLAWSTTNANTNPDLRLYRDAANTLALRNGTAAQAFRIYNTTDGTNSESLNTYWSGNTAYLLTVGVGTGTARNLAIGTAANSATLTLWTSGVERWRIDGSGHLIAVTDNLYDIGAAGANRPRNIFSSSSVVFANSLAVTTVSNTALWNGAQLGWSSGGTVSTTSTLDTGLKRSAAAIVGITNGSTGGGSLEMQEVTAPAAPATNIVRIYAEDNGSGKTRLMALFATGAAQQIAIEP